MFSGFLFADSREIAQELITQLYELSKVTLPKLDVIESLHFTNVDEYDLSYREETNIERGRGWMKKTQKVMIVE